MAPTALRRSRIRDSDDETNSRQSTPASTAPHDSKRARRDAGQDDDDAATPEFDDPDLEPQQDKKPVVTNGVKRRKPKHQPGAIVRVKLTNFVTYTSAEFFPGPNLNMVIGPNGTGKSTLVCAICLGLGWGTQYLGRAKDAAEFIKHGCREATIEIELQRVLQGRDASRVNPIITRTIKREGNKSSYTLNGQSASGKAVMQLARSFDIQIDNLCQFLPQDKVVEFAQMTPIEILQSTQQAAAPPEMLELHRHLKNLREAQKDSNNSKKNDRETLTNLENRQEMQRTEVDRMRERATVQKRLGYLSKCRPIPQYQEAKIRRQEARDKQKTASAERKRFDDESKPTLRKLEAKRLYTNEVEKHKQLREKDVAVAEKECDRLGRKIESYDATMKDCDQIESAEKKSMQKPREEINRTRGKITMLKKEKERVPEPFDSRAINQEISDRVTRTREIGDRQEELRTRGRELKLQHNERVSKGRELNTSLKALETQTGRQEELLKTKSYDSYRAWIWIKENRELFRKPVFGPPMIECTLKDPSLAGSIESVLQQNDFRIFTVQCKEDFKLLQEQLNQKQRLHDVSFRVCPFDSLDRFKTPLSPEQMQQYGLKGWAIDYFEGPPTVLAMLCQEKFLHQTAITDTDITQSQHDQLSTVNAVKSYVTSTKSYQFVRRAEYGAAGIHARERAVRRPDIWTDQPINSGRKQQIEAELQEVRSDMNEIKTQLHDLSKENDELKGEQDRLKEELETLRKEKDEKQNALAAYQGLDTKIAQAEQQVVRLQQTQNASLERLADTQRKRDEAMFAKADTVLEYCNAVHALQERARTLIEAEVAFIEAHNDLTVLAQRNEHLLAMIKQKKEEEKQATTVAIEENKRAKQLMDEVKKLRDEGIELEEKEHDRGLTDMLKELSAMENPKESDLDDMIKVEQAKLALTEGGDANTIKEFEQRARKIEELRLRLTKVNAKQQELLHGIREIRGQWEAPLEALVAKISDAFGESFARIGCAGQVVVFKASSDDPADCTDEMGGSENGLDFANWAVHISVKFRENEPLSLLDSHRQSGGERAVSTIFYLMALQSLSRAPFRVVDEINQGMDPRNERMVHGRMVDIAAADDQGDGQGSQYFLVTPKLLSGLKYKAGMTVLCIVSGENMPSAGATKAKDETGRWVTKAGRKIDFADFARTARRLGLNRGAGKRIDSSVTAGTSFDTLDTLGRSQTSVGA